MAPVDYEGYSSLHGLCFTLLTFTNRNLLVSGHLDNNVRIWDAKSGNSIQELTGIHAGQVTAIEIMKSECAQKTFGECM